MTVVDDPKPAAIPSVGDVVEGKYAIESVLGAGGMGVVVAARHLTLDERVAIKFLKPRESRERESLERFLREARACAKIKSEHVVRVMDCATLPSGMPYILMEHLEGEDLARVPRPLAVTDVVDWVLEACEAIAEAHALGFVHRDLKPSNLFLARRSDGSTSVKVLDFGISKAMTPGAETDPSITDTQSVFGSPAYMSPEQVRSAKRADHRSDVWGLGVILYELLTGEAPFRGEGSSGTLASIVADVPVSPGSLRKEIDAELGAVILHCLEKDPNARFQSVADLARALRPHGGPGAQASVDRIVRVGAPRVSSSGPVSIPAPAPSTPSAPRRSAIATHVLGETVDPVETRPGPRASTRTPAWAFVAGAAALLAVGGIVAWRAGAFSAGVAAPSPDPVVASVASLAPPPPPSAASATSATAASASATSPSTPAAASSVAVAASATPARERPAQGVRPSAPRIGRPPQTTSASSSVPAPLPATTGGNSGNFDPERR